MQTQTAMPAVTPFNSMKPVEMLKGSDYGLRLLAARHVLCLSQADAASELNVAGDTPRSSVARWEAGDAALPKKYHAGVDAIVIRALAHLAA